MPFSRRHLPHLYVVGEPIFITFRLHDSLPPNRWFPARLPSGKAFVCMDRLLDEERTGPSYLRTPAIAQVVVASIREGASAADYALHTWVVMPNNVHLLLTPYTEPSTVLQRIKGVSARHANQLLGLTGKPFWQAESYDHLVRNHQEFQRIQNYILQNPVRAGLALFSETYAWSSAFTPAG